VKQDPSASVPSVPCLIPLPQSSTEASMISSPKWFRRSLISIFESIWLLYLSYNSPMTAGGRWMTAGGWRKHRPRHIPTVQPSLICLNGTDYSSTVSSAPASFGTVENTGYSSQAWSSRICCSFQPYKFIDWLTLGWTSVSRLICQILWTASQKGSTTKPRNTGV